jgi:hypothetical protein
MSFRRLVVVVCLVLPTTVTVAVPPPDELIEVARHRFEVPYRGGFLPLVHESAPLAYAPSGRHLFVVDTSEGAVRNEVDLEALLLGAEDLPSRFFLLDEDSGRTRLAAYRRRGDTLWILSLEDPQDPRLVAGYGIPGHPEVVEPLPDGRTVLTVGDWPGATLLDTDSGRNLHTFAFPSWGGWWEKAAVGGRASRPIVALVNWDRSQSYHGVYHVLTWDVTDARAPTLLSSTEIGTELPGTLLVGERGEIVILGMAATGEAGSDTYILDARTGERLAVLPTNGHRRTPVLAGPSCRPMDTVARRFSRTTGSAASSCSPTGPV